MRRIVLACLTLTLLELLMVRSVNAAGIAIADSSEGCVLHAYKDPTGIWTQGYGHTGQDVKPGSVITQSQADAWRAADMAKAAAFVEAHVRVNLTDNQFSALAEFVFNVGIGNFLGSTLLRKLNQKNYAAIPDQLMRWTKAGGKVLPGLVERRKQEVALWSASEHTPQETVLTKTDPALCTPKPAPPSLVERIRAWFHRNAQVPA